MALRHWQRKVNVASTACKGANMFDLVRAVRIVIENKSLKKMQSKA